MRSAPARGRDVVTVGGTVARARGVLLCPEPCDDGRPPKEGPASLALEPVLPPPPGAVVHLLAHGPGRVTEFLPQLAGRQPLVRCGGGEVGVVGHPPSLLSRAISSRARSRPWAS